MPSASSCLLHVLCFAETHIKRSPNGIKTDGNYFWKIRRIWEEKSTRDGARGRHEAGGRAPDPRGPPVRRLLLFFGCKKANFRRKIWAKVSIQSELRISIYTRNGERAAGRTQKQRETERKIQSRRGSRPSHAMEDKD